MARFSSHDAYIAAAPEPFRPLLARLRAVLAQALPDTEELIMYDMPGFGVGKTVIASYASFSRQCGLYASPGAIAAFADEIAAAGLKASKTGVTFSARAPVPEELVAKIAIASRREVGV